MRVKRVPGIEDGAGCDHAEKLDRREEDREDLLGVDVLLAVCSVQLVELLLERALAVERLHDRHPRHGLRDLRGHHRDPVARLDERDVRRALEPAGQHECGRDDREHDEPESPVGDQQRDHCGRQQDRVRDQRGHPSREHIGDGVDVGCQARDDPARLLLREVTEREARQMVEEVLAQTEHHPLAEPGKATDQPALEHPADCCDAEVDHDDDREVVLVTGADPLVDRVADEQPPAGLADGVPDADEHEYERPRLPPLQIAPEPLHTAARLCNQVSTWLRSFEARLRAGALTPPPPRRRRDP
jgi:hypothetical protein